MKKQGQIKYIDPAGKWNDFDKYRVSFADGTQYSFLAKGNFKADIGEEITYEVTNEQYRSAKLIKEFTPASTSGGNKDQLIVRQTCIKAAAELHAHKQIGDEQVIETAQSFYNWIFQ